MGATQSPISPCSIQGLFWTVLHDRMMRCEAVVHRLVVKPHILYKRRESSILGQSRGRVPIAAEIEKTKSEQVHSGSPISSLRDNVVKCQMLSFMDGFSRLQSDLHGSKKCSLLHSY